MNPPFSPACERNKSAIHAELLRMCGSEGQHFLELGSGTGQHALHFATQQPHWHWQATDRPAALAGIAAWLTQNPGTNTPPALAWDVDQPEHWTALPAVVDWLYTANTFHIMSWEQVQTTFRGVKAHLQLRRGLLVYGPFVREDAPTSPSNLAFDRQLKSQDSAMGLRRLNEVSALAENAGFRLAEVVPMPANNLLLHFQSTQA